MSSLQDQLKNLGFSSPAAAPEESNSSSELSSAVQTRPIRIQRQTKGRKGKGVTVLFDFEISETELQTMASQLRKKCGVGGSVKGETIELQGDQKETARVWLTERGFQVKFAGG